MNDKELQEILERDNADARWRTYEHDDCWVDKWAECDKDRSALLLMVDEQQKKHEREMLRLATNYDNDLRRSEEALERVHGLVAEQRIATTEITFAPPAKILLNGFCNNLEAAINKGEGDG